MEGAVNDSDVLSGIEELDLPDDPAIRPGGSIGRPFGKGEKNPRCKAATRSPGFNPVRRSVPGSVSEVGQPPVIPWMQKPTKPPTRRVT